MSRRNETMTPLERMTAFKKGEQIDRIPCSPSVSEHACRITGAPVRSYLHSARLMAEAQVAAFELYGYDTVSVGPNFHGMAEAMGAVLNFPADDRQQLAAPAIRSYNEIGRLKPADSERDGRLPLYLEALEIIDVRIGGTVSVGTGIGDPFTTAAFLRGTEELLKDLHRNPEFVHALLQLTTQSIINYMDAAMKRGFSCSIGGALSSCSVISARHFREFSKPYLTRIAEWLKQKHAGGLSLHCCGITEPIWNDLADSGVTMFSMDNRASLADAKKAVGERMALKGNVAPVDVLFYGSTEQVMDASRECILQAYDNPQGFVLGSGCSLALDTPSQNVMAMMDAVRVYGKLPVDPEKLQRC